MWGQDPMPMKQYCIYSSIFLNDGIASFNFFYK